MLVTFNVMKVLKHILSKTSPLWIVVIVFFSLFPQTVLAQQLTPTVTMEVDVGDDLNSRVKFTYTYTNPGRDVVKYISIPSYYTPKGDIRVEFAGSVIAPASYAEGILRIDLGLSAIAPGQAGVIVVSFDTSEFVVGADGIYTAVLPAFSAEVELGYDIAVRFSQTLGRKFKYASFADQKVSEIELRGRVPNYGWIVWSDNDIFVDLTQTVTLGKQIPDMLPLPRNVDGQVVLFNQLAGLKGVIADKHENWWLLTNRSEFEDVVYGFRVHNFEVPQRNIIASSPTALPLPDELNTHVEGKSLSQKLDLILEYLRQNYTLLNSEQSQLGAVTTELTLPDSDLLNPLDANILLARMLQGLGVPSHIEYGYYLNEHPLLARTPLLVPHTWLVVKVDDKVLALDIENYMNLGWNPRHSSSIYRLVQGVWGIEDLQMAKTLTSAHRSVPRPTPATHGEIPNDHELRAVLEFPEEVLAGTFLNGTLRVDNTSGEPAEISGVELNGVDITDSVTLVDSNYRVLIAPKGRTEIKIPWYAGRDALAKQSQELRVTLRTKSSLFAPLVVRTNTQIVPNYGLVFWSAGIFVVVLLFVLILVFRQHLIVSIIKRRYLR